MAGKKTSGPGRFSRRTDTDIPKTPGLGGPDRGPTDLQYGDVQKLEAGARIAGASAGRPAPSTARRAEGMPAVPGGLPPYLLDQPTARPEEADTSGLSSGIGPGPEVLEAQTPPPDLRILATRFIADAFSNKAAAKLLDELVNEQAAPSTPAVPAPMAPDLGPQTPGYAGQDVYAPSVDEALAQEPPDNASMPGAPVEPVGMPSPSPAPEPAAEASE